MPEDKDKGGLGKRQIDGSIRLVLLSLIIIKVTSRLTQLNRYVYV